MALVLKDRVKETTTTTGTGTITLAGAASGFQSFAAIGDGNTTYYAISALGLNDWEVGIGTYTSSGTTLSRDTILASSNSGSAVDWSAGSKDVYCVFPASKALPEAVDIPYDNAVSGLAATELQTAIDELQGELAALNLTADNVSYDNTIGGIAATTVQDAFDTILVNEALVGKEIENTASFYYNARTVTADKTISGTENVMSVGPIIIDDAVTITVEDGGEWVIV